MLSRIIEVTVVNEKECSPLLSNLLPAAESINKPMQDYLYQGINI